MFKGNNWNPSDFFIVNFEYVISDVCSSSENI